MNGFPELNAEEVDRYEWQLTVCDFGLEGQRRLKRATVLISRIGGVMRLRRTTPFILLPNHYMPRGQTQMR